MFDFLKIWLNHSRVPSNGGHASCTAKEPGSVDSYAFKHKIIKLDQDLNLAYVDEGSPDKPVLLFVHGVGSGIPVWEKNITELTNQYRCIAIDLPGHGFSSKKDFPYTMDFYTQTVLDFIKQMDLHDVCLVGHSMGGQIAIKASALAPKLISQLILLGPSGMEPYFSYERALLISSINFMASSGQSLTHNHLNYLIGFCYDIETSDELIGKLAFFKNESVMFAIMMKRSVESMLADPVNGLLPELKQKCLVMLGNNDKVSPYNFMRPESFADVVERTVTLIPSVRIVRMDVGHFMQYQDPKMVNKQLRIFLNAEKKENVAL